MSILGLLPARGGSKGVPNKNIRLMCGKPLLAWTAEAARRSGVIDRLVLSTDSEKIAEAGRGAGCEVPFLRPAEFAEDTTPMHGVISHALETLRTEGYSPDIIVLLQPTSPLRSGREIAEAVTVLRDGNHHSVVSVAEIPRHHSPDFVLRLDVNGGLKPFLETGLATRRQDARPAFARDGMVYAFKRSTFETFGNIYGEDCRPILTDAERSLSIDTLDDFQDGEQRLSDFLAKGVLF